MKFLTPIELVTLTSAPTGGTEGRMIYVSGDAVYIDNGSRYISLAPFTMCWPKRASSPKIAGDVAGTALGTLALTASRIYFVPFVVPFRVDLNGLRISVTTAAAGSASVGVYNTTQASGDDVPGTLLASASGLDTGTTGAKTGTFSSALKCYPGQIYWAAVIASAAATVRALAVGSVSSCLGRVSEATTAVTHLFAAGSGSTLPTSAPSVSNGTGSTPAIYLIEA